LLCFLIDGAREPFGPGKLLLPEAALGCPALCAADPWGKETIMSNRVRTRNTRDIRDGQSEQNEETEQNGRDEEI
jgi:hypothetical protein